MYIEGLPLFFGLITFALSTAGFVLALVWLMIKDEEIKKLEEKNEGLLKGYLSANRTITFLRCKYENKEIQ